MSDTKYIKPRHNTYYFQRRVPKALRHLYPNIEIYEVPLGTGDIRKAREKRDIILGRMRQQELEQGVISPEKQAFKKYVAELEIAKEQRNVGSKKYPVSWDDVCDPYTQRKEDEPAYVEAYYAVLNNKSESPKYRLTLRELLQRFLHESVQEETHTEGTRNRYKKTLDLYLSYHGTKDIQLQEVTRVNALDFISHYRSTELSGATVQGHVSRLKTLWLFAYRHALITGDNPFDKHQINTRKGRKKKQPFTPDEMHKLINAFKTSGDSSRLLMWLGYFTGARISELVSIELETITVEAGIRVFKIKAGKTEAAVRTVPIPPRCYQLLDSVRKIAEEKDNIFLFHDLYSHQYPERPAYDATKIFGDLKRKYVTNRSDKGSHSFRVMLSTALHQAEVAELEAAYLIGHSRKGLTLTYDYYSVGYNIKQLARIQSRGIKQLETNMGTALHKVI